MNRHVNDVFTVSVMIIIFLFGVTGVVLGVLAITNPSIESRIHIIGIMEFPMAVEDPAAVDAVPIQYVVRYVFDRRLEEIAVYSREEADALIAHLSGDANEK